jgi:hypothetical protein
VLNNDDPHMPHQLRCAIAWGVIEVSGPTAPCDVVPWSGCIRRFLVPGSVVVCDLRPLECADLAVVDALARLQLHARHAGARLHARGCSAALSDLWRWVGLGDVGPL